ncbi:P27 family phage terminase small subunit [Clostridium cadaveris]|uniref:P27 family phage terminase small subunit n=1 Tax=Clostridium cadaveris TaxID=1529 RepID=UPI0015B4ADB4|nr:P27 family phage terminase small subunit [Clostridium cadaveris]NWK10415.1 P27 family phage terminase small subunit [Clostridium cadaveris]
MSSAKKIKESLIKQLEEKNADTEYFLKLVDDYLWYFNQEKAMQKDIKERGFSFKTTSASGYEIEKENPSIKNAVMYNKQKLAILKQLNLTTDNVSSDEDDSL